MGDKSASQYGILTANFEEISPLKFDFLFGLIGALAAIPVIGGLLYKYRSSFSKRGLHKTNLNMYLKRIDTLSNTSSENKQEYLDHLDAIRMEITDLLGKDMISESQYKILIDRISHAVEKANRYK